MSKDSLYDDEASDWTADGGAGSESATGYSPAELENLQDDVVHAVRQAGRDPGAWTRGKLNNARLVSMNLYEGRLPEFRQLLADCEQEPECFYERARSLAAR